MKEKDDKTTTEVNAHALALRMRSPRALTKAIFSADIPEEVLRTLPAQSLYMAIQANGLESSTDLIEILRPEQYRACLDFALWEKDSFNQDGFFAWLALTEEKDNFNALHRFLGAVDLKLVGLLLARYVQVVIFDEPTDRPPEAQCYTPDRGYTWITISVDDPEQHRHLGRLLAFLFDTNTELFYQLISLPSTSTNSELEEESYQERSKRMLDQGFPDMETAARVNSAGDRAAIYRQLGKTTTHFSSVAISSVEPILHGASLLSPLSLLLDELREHGSSNDIEAFQIELTWITNAAFMHYATPLTQFDEMTSMIERVRGALNIGLEDALQSQPLSSLEAFRSLGLRSIYRLGHAHLHRVSIQASSIALETIQAALADQPACSIIAAARERFPRIPLFFSDDGHWQQVEGHLLPGFKAFEHLLEVQGVVNFIKARFGN